MKVDHVGAQGSYRTHCLCRVEQTVLQARHHKGIIHLLYPRTGLAPHFGNAAGDLQGNATRHPAELLFDRVDQPASFPFRHQITCTSVVMTGQSHAMPSSNVRLLRSWTIADLAFLHLAFALSCSYHPIICRARAYSSCPSRRSRARPAAAMGIRSASCCKK